MVMSGGLCQNAVLSLRLRKSFSVFSSHKLTSRQNCINIIIIFPARWFIAGQVVFSSSTAVSERHAILDETSTPLKFTKT